MLVISKILIGLVVIIHLYILWFEMFAWETRGRKIFKKFPRELFGATKELAANQGLYNGFLAAGLLWSLSINDENWSFNIAFFFLICVLTAGLYGTFTADKKIFWVQALPALLAILFLIFSHY